MWPLVHVLICLLSDLVHLRSHSLLVSGLCVGKDDRSSKSIATAGISCRQPEEVPSDGARMTTELRDIVCQFMQKVRVNMCQRRNLYTTHSCRLPSTNQVDGFKRSVSHMSVSTAEQQAVSLISILYVVQSKAQLSSAMEMNEKCVG